ncbi:hypothetical protein [Ruminiclostridium hungatei]|nr:hypothetical protein [Ruminiclostridium hungatei]
MKKENTKSLRCGKIYFEKKGCEDCKGCSLWKTCKKPERSFFVDYW